MKGILKNWKTTIAGIVTIVLSILTSKGKLDPTTAAGISGGIGLILAADHKEQTDSTKFPEDHN